MISNEYELDFPTKPYITVQENHLLFQIGKMVKHWNKTWGYFELQGICQPHNSGGKKKGGTWPETKALLVIWISPDVIHQASAICEKEKCLNQLHLF